MEKLENKYRKILEGSLSEGEYSVTIWGCEFRTNKAGYIAWCVAKFNHDFLQQGLTDIRNDFRD